MNFTNKDFRARIHPRIDLNASISNELGPKNLATKVVSKNRQNNEQSTELSERADGAVPKASRQLPAVIRDPTTSFFSENFSTVSLNTTSINISHLSDRPCVIAAITEGRGHAQGEIGLASLDVNSPSLILTQISDAFCYRDILLKLQILQPVEILIPLTIFNSGSKLLDQIKINFQSAKIVPIPRRHFSNDGIMTLIRSLCTSDCRISLNAIEKKYYAVSAASGLLMYLTNMLLINFAPNGLKIEYQGRNARMLLDYESYHRLELIYSLADTKEKRCCLFGFLNHTLTNVGSRCLRAFILEPFCSLSNIYDMQASIKELLDNPNWLYTLQETIKQFSQCDQLIKLCILPPDSDKAKSIEMMLNQILLLKSTLCNLPELRNIVSQFKTSTFCKAFQMLQDVRFEIMLKDIVDVVQPEIQTIKRTAQCFQRIYAIRSGVNEYLDLTRTIYSQLADSIRSKISELAVKFELPLRMIYTVAKGFHIQLTSTVKNPITVVPPEFEMLYKRGNSFYLINPELSQLNVRMTDVIEEMHIASHSVARKLIEKLAFNADASYALVAAVSSLDIVLSLATVSAKDEYCCPTFSDETRIVDGIYPFLEYSSARPDPVPNNIIGTPDYSFYVITGPNMGGKTIYIKTIAILQIMAQMGCYVPAKKAQFRICDRIFTRIGFEDKIEKKSSSYVLEMKEIEYIFENLTPNSIVLIDELCRSTNPEEGKQIALKICLKLATFNGVKQDGKDDLESEKKENSKVSSSLIGRNILEITAPFIYLTTHFMELTKLADTSNNISNLYLHADETFINDKLHLNYTHRVMEGVTPIKGYGLALTRTIRFPGRVLLRAEEIYEQLLTKEKDLHTEPEARPLESSAENDSIFQNLQDILNSKSQQFSKRSDTSVNLIASFLRKSNLNESSTRSQNQSVLSGEIVKDLKDDLYDLYASIASLKRNKTNNNAAECQNVLDDFVSRQSYDLLTALSKLQLENNELVEALERIPSSLETDRIPSPSGRDPSPSAMNIDVLESISTMLNVQISEGSPLTLNVSETVALNSNLLDESKSKSSISVEESFQDSSCTSKCEENSKRLDAPHPRTSTSFCPDPKSLSNNRSAQQSSSNEIVDETMNRLEKSKNRNFRIMRIKARKVSKPKIKTRRIWRKKE